ncbi:hypothetical protein T492DRAFT_901478, partial [Pavlovales sp. CCMP2436]
MTPSSPAPRRPKIAAAETRNVHRTVRSSHESIAMTAPKVTALVSKQLQGLAGSYTGPRWTEGTTGDSGEHRASRARAGGLLSGKAAAVAVPPPARAKFGRSGSARRAAAESDGESDGDPAAADSDDEARKRGDAALGLAEGERATECCFWHDGAPLSAALLASRRFEPLHAEGRGASGATGMSACEGEPFTTAREQAHDAHVALIEAEVAALVAQTNAHAFNGVVGFLRAHPPDDGLLPLAIVATRCNAHDEAQAKPAPAACAAPLTRALSLLGAHVRAAGLSRFVVHLRAADCASVHTAVRALASALLDAPGGGGGGGAVGRPNGSASHDLRLVSRWFASRAGAALV